MSKKSKPASKNNISQICELCNKTLKNYEPVVTNFWEVIYRSSLEDKYCEKPIPKANRISEMLRDMKILLRICTLFPTDVNRVSEFKKEHEKKWTKAKIGAIDILNYIEDRM